VGCRAGAASLTRPTPVETLRVVLVDLDLLLVMDREFPASRAQKFHPRENGDPKIAASEAAVDGRAESPATLEVDGGNRARLRSRGCWRAGRRHDLFRRQRGVLRRLTDGCRNQGTARASVSEQA
jgi:hypothetical protein